jgi:hypothetical protein
MSAVRPNTFKFAQLNAENLFLFLDDTNDRDWRKLTEKDWQRLSHASVPNKPLVKTLWLAETLLDIDADIVGINEVGGAESLANFAKFFLKDRYTPHLIEGNSDRGIDIGYLVKKDFPYRVELRTHKNRPLGFQYPHEVDTNLYLAGLEPERVPRTHYFSRDCAELRVYDGDSPVPGLISLLVHLKSKLDPEHIDPEGRGRREAEMRTLMQIYREVRAEFSPPVPVILAGDFNGSARKAVRSGEFAELTNTDLESVMDLVGKEGDDAATQIQFSRGGGISGLQIDYVFISQDLKPHLIPNSVEVFRYRSDLKIPLSLPKTLEQRTYLPSDHYPVVAAFTDFIKRK